MDINKNIVHGFFTTIDIMYTPYFIVPGIKLVYLITEIVIIKKKAGINNI